MNIILLPRGGGKTETLIRLAAKEFAYIVCIDRSECQRVARIASEKGYDIPFPITFDEFLSGNFYGKGARALMIDNADLLLQRMANHARIAAISLTDDLPF